MENFEDKKTYNQDRLIQILGFQTQLPRDTVTAALEFFVEGTALQLVETISEEDDYLLETYVAMNADFPGFNSILQGLREQVAWRFAKLNAMHQLVKGPTNPRLSIEQYFQ